MSKDSKKGSANQAAIKSSLELLPCEHVTLLSELLLDKRVTNFTLPVDTLKMNRLLRSRRQVRKEEKLL